MVKNVTQSLSAILRKALRKEPSRSSLCRTNHELRYKVELLKIHNQKLVENLAAVKDENIMLWQHMEEMREAEKAIMKSITDEYEQQLLRGLVPVGDA